MAHVARRLAMLPVVLLGVALVVFMVMHLVPGPPSGKRSSS